MGRGVSDDKGPAVLTSYMMKFFKEQNLDLPYTMRAIFGSDEETGSSDVRCYLQQEKPPVFIFTPDADFPVCCGEKGIASFSLASKKIENGNVVKFKAGVASNVISDPCPGRNLKNPQAISLKKKILKLPTTATQ